MKIRVPFFSFTLLLSVFAASCKKNNDTSPNSAPGSFTVIPNVATDSVSVILNWAKAKDPDGDPVTYTVVYKDTLVKNLTDTTYIIKNAGNKVKVEGRVIAFDSKRASTSANFNITTGVGSSYVAIPDVNFERALVNLKIDDAQNGVLLKANALKVTTLNVSGNSISDLQGIGAFVNLTRLICSNNKLTTLNLSTNIALTYLDFAYNSLISIDLSKSSALKELYCYSNKLTSLDVSKNNELQFLKCEHNSLTNMNVSQNTQLSYMSCTSNNIQTICVNSLSQPNSQWFKDDTASYKVCQ